MRKNKKVKKVEIPRFWILAVVFLVLFAILIHRVFVLQIVNGQDYADNFTMMTTKTRALTSTRGNIYDRNGKLLAYNQLSYSVTLEDNGTYASTREKQLQLNGEIYKIIRLLEENGDSLDTNFHVIINDESETGEEGVYAYDVSGITLSRFKADVYGKSLIDDLEEDQAAATADEMMAHLKESYGLINPDKPYSEKELTDAGLPTELTVKETLKIISVRYALFTTSFRRYVQVTIATDVSEATVAAIQENSSELQGVAIAEDSVRVYNDSIYFAPILGYTGKISSDELAELRDEYPDAGYSTTSIVGKSGIEQIMEAELQGQDGYETVYVDTMGKVLEIDEKNTVQPSQGNNVYLTLDADLQIAGYKLLEQQIAGIVAENIRDIKTFEFSEDTDASTIPIPIYDVYHALINNSIIDTSHFTDDDATETERRVQAVYEEKLQEVFARIEEELTGSSPKAYQDLDEEMQAYFSYIVNDMLMDKTGILSSTAIDKNDDVYKAWTTGKSISLQEYLTYASSQNWIDISQFSDKTTYLDSAEVYSELSQYITDYLQTDTDFSKILYKYLLLEDRISGYDLCLILYEQGVLSTSDGVYEQFVSGELSPMNLMMEKIRNLEITPAQLALDPCTGSMVIVDPNNGEVLACVSYPGYDNNRLANTMDTAYYRKLNNDLSMPFYNKATQERTAPGSTFKPITAIAGMMEGVIEEDTLVNCTGRFEERTGAAGMNCWLLSGHGSLNVTKAISESCNVFFGETAYLLGQSEEGVFSDNAAMQRLIEYSELFNLDKPSGIEITEASPQVSDQLPIPSAIGQGTHNYTTSQIARYVASIANSGTSYNISLLDKVTDAQDNLVTDYTPEVLSTIDLDSSLWDIVHEGMEGVILNGSCSSYFNDLDITLAGKTGTAQQSRSRANHGLFVGYAPAKEPEIAWAIRIANGYSSTNAVSVGRGLLSYYFNLEDESSIITGQAASADSSNARID